MPADEPACPGQVSSGGAFAEAIPLVLLDEPLEHVLVDHCRQRSLCAALRRLSETGHVERAEADRIAAYLKHDLDLHHRDEDEDLFPLLLRRILPEDALEPVLARLAADHRESVVTVEAILETLAAGPAEGPVKLAPATRKLMLAYAASERHHLAAENGIVLAIARIRLTRGDLRAMTRTMKERRGVPV